MFYVNMYSVIQQEKKEQMDICSLTENVWSYKI